MARYDSFGPFKLERVDGKVTRAALKKFWAERKADSEGGLCGAVGVYVIAVQSRVGGEFKPWYVGRTDRLGFEDRFYGHELLFRKILDEAKRGQLFIFLLGMRSPSGRVFRKVSRRDISHNDWLESTVIGSALSKNSNLLNVSKTKKLKTLILPGLLNTPRGRLTEEASALKKMLHST